MWKDSLPNSSIFYEDENTVLYLGDCSDIIPNIKNNLINLVITSPPYNVDLGNNKFRKQGYNLYRDNREHSEYIEWLSKIFTSLYGKLAFGARIAVNIGDGKNGKVPTHSDIIQSLKGTYLPISVIIWNKSQTTNRTAWGSFMSPSSPSYPTPFEYILLFAKGSYKLGWSGRSDLTREEFIKWAYALWSFAPERNMKKFGHPAMFPEELPKRVIKMNSYIGDVVLDPFVGAGTSAVVAKRLGRKFIGIDIDPDYLEITVRRLKEVKV